MNRTRLLMALVAGLALGGCDDSSPRKSTPSKPAAKKKADVAEKKDAPADKQESEEAVSYVYSYNPLGKRDPFRSPVLDQVRVDPGAAACNEPLCMWDLDQLVLTAVVTGDANPIAMLEDPRGRGYVVRRNSRVGKQGGKITQILRDSITVTEYWSDPTGKVIPKPTQKMIKEERNLVPALDLVSGKTFE